MASVMNNFIFRAWYCVLILRIVLGISLTSWGVVLQALFNSAVGGRRKELDSVADAVVPEVLLLPPCRWVTSVPDTSAGALCLVWWLLHCDRERELDSKLADVVLSLLLAAVVSSSISGAVFSNWALAHEQTVWGETLRTFLKTRPRLSIPENKIVHSKFSCLILFICFAGMWKVTSVQNCLLWDLLRKTVMWTVC